MLVLSRRVSEVIEISAGPGAEPIKVMVVGVSGDRVRIGVQADKSVAVHRSEVAERIRHDPPIKRSA